MAQVAVAVTQRLARIRKGQEPASLGDAPIGPRTGRDGVWVWVYMQCACCYAACSIDPTEDSLFAKTRSYLGTVYSILHTVFQSLAPRFLPGLLLFLASILLESHAPFYPLLAAHLAQSAQRSCECESFLITAEY